MTSRFDRVAIFLHWSIAIGIIAVALAEMLRGELPRGSAIREGLKFAHNPAGTIIFGLVLARIVWRLSHAPPNAPLGTPSVEKYAAAASHIALYGMMIAIPLVGIIYTLARGRPIDFGAFQIVYPLNHLIGAGTTRALKEIHEVLGQAILVLAFIHAIAALWHHYVRGDDVLTRMLPSRMPPRRPDGPPSPAAD